jgi:uncharacterized protein (TIGR02599 family)
MKQAKNKVHKGGFSLIELLTAMTILSVLMLMMTSLLDQVQRSWRSGESRVSQFREARVAFDLITKNMSQATMNTYWDYNYDKNNQIDSYKKRTDLHFYSEQAQTIEGKLGLSGQTSGHVVFFQAPLGYSVRYRNLDDLFNGRGYLVVYGSDRDFIPSFVPKETFRFRLMEFRPPAEANQVFKDAIDELEKAKPGENPTQDFKNWWNQGISGIGGNFKEHLNPLAQNIILLLVTPMDSLEAQTADRYDTSSQIAPNYIYDSNNTGNSIFGQQVPPLVKVTMVAIDETTAIQLEDQYGQGKKPPIVPDNLFKDTRDYNEDIKKLTDFFNDHSRNNKSKIDYRIFSSIVMLRSAKWVTDTPIKK